ncbi:MAG TPA: DUF222 domain-containing protein [Thermoanaerobaculia bacterium]|nr:DUF222 domain-containing protein [Thermoanaerobaculia bacterium]
MAAQLQTLEHASRRSIEDLGDQIAELAAHIGAATYRLLVLLQEFDRREGWGCGFRSCAHWLCWRTGIDLGAAREKVRVARALAGLPLLSEAMRRGEVSYSKIRALTRVATAETEAELLMIAKSGTTAHVEKLVRAWRRCNRLAELEHANDCHGHRSVQYHWDEEGMLVLRARLDPEVGATLLRALEAAEGELYRRAQPDELGEAGGETVPEETTAEQRRADGLALVAEAALGGGIADGRHRTAERFQVVVHVEAREEPSGVLDLDGGVLEDGERVSAETCRRLACDAGLVRMTDGPEGQTLSVGRKTRSIPPAIRRALDRRDARCRFPGCGSRRCDAHHVEHWADGGETRLENLLLLCRRHHRAVHEEGFTVELRATGEARFRSPDGRLLALSPAPPPLPQEPVHALFAAHRSAGLGIGPTTVPTPEYGVPFELAETVNWFVGAAARAEELAAASKAASS